MEMNSFVSQLQWTLQYVSQFRLEFTTLRFYQGHKSLEWRIPLFRHIPNNEYLSVNTTINLFHNLNSTFDKLRRSY